MSSLTHPYVIPNLYEFMIFFCHMIPQKSFEYADLVLNKQFLLSMLKRVVLLYVFVETLVSSF